jgi:hypothetical protein
LSSHSNALPSCAPATVWPSDCRATARAAICPVGTSLLDVLAMQNLRIFACVAAALGSMAIAGCSSSDDGSGRLRVRNQSDFAITEIHVTSVGSPTWGPNLISGDILAPGEILNVDVSCDNYDALLVDESGAQCTVHNVDLCFNTADWVIQNDTCPVFAIARAAREAAQAAGSASSAQ